MLKRVSGPALEPVSVTEAKSWLRITGDDENTLIGTLVSQARQWVEEYTRRALLAQTWDLTLQKFPACIDINRSPLRSVTWIKYNDTNGDQQTLATTEYTVDDVSEPAKVIEAYSKTWPSTYGHINDVTVRFVAGYAATMTAVAATNVLTAVGHSYADTDPVRFWNTGGSLPGGLVANTDYYVRDVSGDTFKVAATSGGSAIDITTPGTGVHFVGEIPRPIIQAMLLLVGELYERREAAIVGAPITEVPFGVQALLAPYRVWTF